MNRTVVGCLGIVATMIAIYIWLSGNRSTEAEALGGVVLLVATFITFLAIALGESEGRSGGDVRQEVHFHGQPNGHAQPQAQPVFYPQPQAPAQPQFVFMPSPAPAAPQIVMMSPEMLAQLQGQHAGPGAPRQLQGVPVPHGYATQQLTVAPDGRYISAPYAEAPRYLPAPQGQPARPSLMRRLLS